MVLLMPIELIVWMVGWVLCWIGFPDGRQRRKAAVKDNGIEIVVPVLEEEAELDS
jgi:hypothetical protein